MSRSASLGPDQHLTEQLPASSSSTEEHPLQTLLQEDEAQGGFGESACSVELVRPVYLCRESAVTSGRAAGRHTGSQLAFQTDAESYLTVQLLPLSVQPQERLNLNLQKDRRTLAPSLYPP